MTEPRYRVLAIASHPVQYMSPIFRRMATRSDLELHVAYCSLRGAEAAHDPDFAATVQWDVPLLEGYSWAHIPNRGDGSQSFFGLRNPGLWKLIRQSNFDAILCFTGYRCATFWIALLAARISDTAFLFGTDTITFSPRDGSIWKTRVKRFLWPSLFRLADQVIVPSSGSRDLMLSLGLPTDRITLTPYSVDNDWWIRQSSLIDRDAVRSAWGVSSDDTVILFCAKLQPWKRPLDLLRAFAKADLSNGILVYAGDGPLRQQLASEAESLGIAARVRFLGFVNQSRLPAVYASADLMVLPSEYEPFAVVVNEAMCCRCPVVTSDHVGAARDLVTPVDAQLIYPCGNIDALAAILTKISQNRSHLQALGRAALERMQHWSPEQNIAATVEAIRIAVSRKHRHTSQSIQAGSTHSSQSAASRRSAE